MCNLFGGGSKETSSSTSKTEIDPIAQKAKNIALGRGLDILNQSYVGYDPSLRVAGFSPDQEAGFTAVRNYANAAPHITSSRVVDQNGRLGKIKDYIDPYIANALKPAIRDLRESGQVQRNDIGAGATMAGAFGDSRHGIAEGQQMKMEDQAVGDLTATGYSNAYQQAMGQRSTDLDRFASTDVLKDQMQLNKALSLLGIGDQHQQHTQAQMDALYNEFQQAREWPFRQFDLITALTGGTPTAQNTTVTTQQPQTNPLWQILGALGGSVLGGH